MNKKTKLKQPELPFGKEEVAEEIIEVVVEIEDASNKNIPRILIFDPQNITNEGMDNYIKAMINDVYK